MIEVFCDGGARGNPGPAAFGFVIKKSGKIIKQGKGCIGVATNNFAEYTALIKALMWLEKNLKGAEIQVFLDSLLVVSQLSGIYKVKNATIRELVFKVRELEPSFTRVHYKHIGRHQNQEADALVNKALDQLNGT